MTTHKANSEEEILWITNGCEEQNLEFKTSMSLEHALARVELLKAMMAMANLKDGGVVVVGVEDSGHPRGVKSDDLKTYSKDRLAKIIDQYVEPSIDFTLKTISHDGKSFIFIRVSEFREYPIVCKKGLTAHDHKANAHRIEAGTVYIRPRAKIESSSIKRYEDMKELLDLAIDKGMRRMNVRMGRWGVSHRSVKPKSSPRDDAVLFKAELQSKR